MFGLNSWILLVNSDYANCDVNFLTDLRPDLSNICCGAFHGMDPCLCLRVENRPSVLGIFIYVPWGGVGWGNNVHVLAHSHDVTPRHVHLHVRTYVMLRWRCVTSRRGGVGGVITFTYLRTPMMLRHGTFTCTCAHTSCYVEDVDLIWTYVSHMAVAMGGKCSWKSPVGENRCVLSEDVEITGKNGYRWGFGHADFPKGTCFALRHVNYIQ